jgi:hypothetical protein
MLLTTTIAEQEAKGKKCKTKLYQIATRVLNEHKANVTQTQVARKYQDLLKKTKVTN